MKTSYILLLLLLFPASALSVDSLVTVGVELDKPSYRHGDTLHASFIVRNDRPTNVTIWFADPCYPFACVDSTGSGACSPTRYLGCPQVLVPFDVPGSSEKAWPLSVPLVDVPAGAHSLETYPGLVYDGYRTVSTPFTVRDNDTVLVPLRAGWNLVSVPLSVEDSSVTSLFPTARAPLYGYRHGSYTVESATSAGRGYWLKLAAPETLQFVGQWRSADTVDVVAGWNMIGSLSADAYKDSVTSMPPGIISGGIYGTDCGYAGCSPIMHPGWGYWVKVTQPGKIILRPD